jgi:hypothetical protein
MRKPDVSPDYLPEQLLHALRIALRGDVGSAQMLALRIQRATRDGQAVGSLVTDEFRERLSELVLANSIVEKR